VGEFVAVFAKRPSSSHSHSATDTKSEEGEESPFDFTGGRWNPLPEKKKGGGKKLYLCSLSYGIRTRKGGIRKKKGKERWDNPANKREGAV